jgi:riboflavin kinase / FMN adenylyltransferase
VYPGLLAAAGPLAGRPLHLAIGMFDGVHLGHRAVLEAAVRSAQRCAGRAAVLTFHPHPSRVVRPEEPVRLIQSPQQRAQRILACGVDGVIVQPFEAELASLEAEQFLPHLRRFLPSLVALYVGENWRFGRGRRGDIDLLNREARKAGVEVVSAPRINHNGEPISSTRIRACLQAGDIRQANTLLGAAYSCAGPVQPGKRLGRTIGFPTLNIRWEPECQPRLGVYAVRVREGENETALPAVANYGLRPTVEDTERPQLEVHVLGECPWTEGDVVKVDWLEFLRPERRFASLDELRQQIAQDVVTARRLHGR